jgi:hypothetical protein
MNPAMFHGHGQAPPFFEGWYYKLVSQDGSQRFAIIPGVFFGEDGHAFVQVLNGNTAKTAYHRFDLSKFWASEEDFEARIGDNFFSQDSVTLNIDDQLGLVNGKLAFQGLKPWPVSITSPGIMGWYAWVPKMECYHGVLSFDHRIQGQLKINQEIVDFTGGRGYIEKDWGQSFPAGYIWFQSNHFDIPETSLTASVAVIPWMGSAFRGFIIGLWNQGRLYRFATYTGAKIKSLEIMDDSVNWVVQDRRYRLEMAASRSEGGLLHGPSRVQMLQRVEESMSATVDIQLSTLSGQVIFDSQGRNTAMEVHGDLDRLLAMN